MYLEAYFSQNLATLVIDNPTRVGLGGNVMAGGMVKYSLVDRVGLLDCTGFAHKPSLVLLEPVFCGGT